MLKCISMWRRICRVRNNMIIYKRMRYVREKRISVRNHRENHCFLWTLIHYYQSFSKKKR